MDTISSLNYLQTPLEHHVFWWDPDKYTFILSLLMSCDISILTLVALLHLISIQHSIVWNTVFYPFYCRWTITQFYFYSWSFLMYIPLCIKVMLSLKHKLLGWQNVILNFTGPDQLALLSCLSNMSPSKPCHSSRLSLNPAFSGQPSLTLPAVEHATSLDPQHISGHHSYGSYNPHVFALICRCKSRNYRVLHLSAAHGICNLNNNHQHIFFPTNFSFCHLSPFLLSSY